MKVFIEQLWASATLPWKLDEPWNTVLPNGSIVISQNEPNISYGIKILPAVESLQLSQIEPALSYGIKFITDVSILVLNGLNPVRIGSVWNRLQKVSTIWTDIVKTSGEIWEDYGTILWSWRNNPWLSTYFPWQEKGGVKPVTAYTNTDKPSTNYSNINKPDTTYNSINKPL